MTASNVESNLKERKGIPLTFDPGFVKVTSGLHSRFGLVINYVLENSVGGGFDIGLNVADHDFADYVALAGNCETDVGENLQRIEGNSQNLVS